MDISHESGLAERVLAHPKIENHMTRDYLISNKILGIAVIFINCIINLGGLLVYCISPKTVTVMFVNI